MAGAGKSFQFLLVLFVGFFLLPVSVSLYTTIADDVDELNQGFSEDNLTISYNHTFPFLVASFGGPLVEGVEYHVSVASPNRKACCDPIDPPPTKDHLTDQFWIVVIQRRDCLFVQKVRNAQGAGYDAAIIHNIGSNTLVRMAREDGDDAKDIHIPAFFIGQDDGVNLANEYFQAQKKGQTLLLTMETKGLEPTNFKNKNLILVAFFALYIGIVALVVLLVFLLNQLIKKYFVRQQKKRLAGLGTLSNSLATIPTKTFESGDPYETCSICTEDYAKGDSLRLLHCSHAFHSKCIDKWLANHRRICPLCNQDVESQKTSVDVV